MSLNHKKCCNKCDFYISNILGYIMIMIILLLIKLIHYLINNTFPCWIHISFGKIIYCNLDFGHLDCHYFISKKSIKFAFWIFYQFWMAYILVRVIRILSFYIKILIIIKMYISINIKYHRKKDNENLMKKWMINIFDIIFNILMILHAKYQKNIILLHF